MLSLPFRHDSVYASVLRSRYFFVCVLAIEERPEVGLMVIGCEKKLAYLILLNAMWNVGVVKLSSMAFCDRFLFWKDFPSCVLLQIVQRDGCLLDVNCNFWKMKQNCFCCFGSFWRVLYDEVYRYCIKQDCVLASTGTA